jgi:hypothetical protein
MNAHLQSWQVSPDTFPGDGFASDRIEFLLHYAILAPSPQNTQPWLFRLNVSDVEIVADRRRARRAADPHNRELIMSCGAALYNLRIAAEYFGQSYSVELVPDPLQPNLLARLTLRGGQRETTADDVVLFRAMTERRTNRELFRIDPVPDPVLSELTDAAEREGAWLDFVMDPQQKSALAALVAQADRIQWANRDYRRETTEWLRKDPEHHADGVSPGDLGIRNWVALAGTTMIRTFERGNGKATKDSELASSSPVLALLGTNSDDACSWLMAGQALESVLLYAQANGIAASHLNSPIEVESLRTQLSAQLGRTGYPQVLLRLGYGIEVPPTPRRDLRSMVLKQDTSKAPPH